MLFETGQIHFLSDVLICRHVEILLPWQRDVNDFPSPLHLQEKSPIVQFDITLTQSHSDP